MGYTLQKKGDPLMGITGSPEKRSVMGVYFTISEIAGPLVWVPKWKPKARNKDTAMAACKNPRQVRHKEKLWALPCGKILVGGSSI